MAVFYVIWYLSSDATVHVCHLVVNCFHFQAGRSEFIREFSDQAWVSSWPKRALADPFVQALLGQKIITTKCHSCLFESISIVAVSCLDLFVYFENQKTKKIKPLKSIAAAIQRSVKPREVKDWNCRNPNQVSTSVWCQ